MIDSLERIPFCVAKFCPLLKKFPKFYVTHDHFNKNPLLFPIPSHINPVDVSHPISRKYIPVLSSHLLLDIPSKVFPLEIPTKTLHDPRRRLFIPDVKCYIFTVSFSPNTMKDNSLSSSRDFLFSNFAAPLHIWRASPSCAT